MTRWPFLHLIRLIMRRLVSIRSYIHSYIFSISFKVIQIWRRNTLIKVVTAAASFYLLYSLYVAIKAYLEGLSPLEDSLQLLDHIDIDCDGLINGEPEKILMYKRWDYTLIERIERTIRQSNNRCTAMRTMFQFRSEPLSKEEKDYPLAYGLVVYMNAVQVLFELSAFYHPQNEYCIAVSGSAEESVSEFMDDVNYCFPNIHIIKRPPLNWGEFEIINSTFACLEWLQKSRTPWKYYQYLSGADVPLRTNLEMVRIFKRLNETVNTYVEPFPLDRLRTRKASESPLPLIKSPLSLLLPRKTVNDLVNTPTSKALLNFLSPTYIADESFWATMLGNPSHLNITGGFDGKRILAFQKLYALEHPAKFKSYISSTVAKNGYISRYQVWTSKQCKGKMFRYSCVYGVEDLPVITKQDHLVAHKLYIDYQPAAYFCLLKRVRKRESSPVDFDSSPYAEIPLVELSRGIPFQNLTHPEWLLRLHELIET